MMRSASEVRNVMALLRTKAEAAAALNVSIRTFEGYMRRGEIAVVRLGRRTVRVEQAELERFVQRLAHHDSEPAA
jgi:excisionase family DNA binding protein